MDESEIPIDIHTSKLMDWLISRRHVPHDWSKRVLTVREKINEAIKDMPEDKRITALLAGSYINYYHCKKIIEILKETEMSSKNLFGQYTSKRMKDWVEILKLYEKDNIYLGEVGSLLLRNVNYEVPALRKLITKAITLKNEYDKKEVGYEKNADSIIRDFNSTCKSLGIKGSKIKKELAEKASEFPQMCEEIAKEIRNLKLAASFYINVVQSILDTKKHPLEILQYVIENGNTTVYQWKYKKIPSSIKAVTLLVDEADDDDKNGDSDVIDFGEDTTEQINFDDDIDWGISTVEEQEREQEHDIEEDKNIATGDDAHTILGYPDTRNLILNDVLELETFLKVRIHEMKSETDGLGLTMLPESLQIYDLKALNEMLIPVQTVKQSLTNPTSLHYLNIMTNQKYIDQLAEKLKQKLSSHEKMLASKEFIKLQRAEAIKEGDSIKPKLDLLIKKSKELQSQIEEDISKRYKGRPVNLIAGASIL